MMPMISNHAPAPTPAPTPAAPFVKWAGGKRALMPSLIEHFPHQIGTYWEPFVGGGAVFFAMADRIDRAILSDTNAELICTYNIVKGRVEDLIARLKDHASKHKQDEAYYLQVRGQSPTDPLAIAARFIYLNKTCYNGLYRVNRSGRFNVPKGRYDNPLICDEARLRTASAALAKATIKQGDFAATVCLGEGRPGEKHPGQGNSGQGDSGQGNSGQGDSGQGDSGQGDSGQGDSGQGHPAPGHFIYCDPPYDDCFTDYQAGGFGCADQIRLRDSVDAWAAKGAQVMVSNSYTPLIRRLYPQGKYNRHIVKAPRAINSKASARGAVAEVIIRSYAL